MEPHDVEIEWSGSPAILEAVRDHWSRGSVPSRPVRVILLLCDPHARFSKLVSSHRLVEFGKASANSFADMKRGFDMGVGGVLRKTDGMHYICMPMVQCGAQCHECPVENVGSHSEWPESLLQLLPSGLLCACLLFTTPRSLAKVAQCSLALKTVVVAESRFLLHGVARMVHGIDRILLWAASVLGVSTVDSLQAPPFQLVELCYTRPISEAETKGNTRVFVSAWADIDVGSDLEEISAMLRRQHGLAEIDYIVDKNQIRPFARSPKTDDLRGPLPGRVR